MSSHTSIGIERKIEHTFFLLSVWSKGVAGFLETLGQRIEMKDPPGAW